MKTFVAVALTALFTFGFAGRVPAAILYSTAGSTYSQDFNSLPITPENTSLGSTPNGWTDDSTSPGTNQFSIPGWYLYHVSSQSEGGANGRQRMRIGAGTANTGAFMSYGLQGDTERALGSLASNTTTASSDGGVAYIGLRLTNDTGNALTEFSLAYTGEQWRDGGNTTSGSVAQMLTFDYMIGATDIQDAGFTAVPELDFTSPSFGAMTADTTSNLATNRNWRNGNDAANRTAIGPVVVTGLNWLPGTDLWLRWSDINDSGNDHGLAIDDVSFSANAQVVIPEPASLLLLVFAGAGLASIRRRT